MAAVFPPWANTATYIVLGAIAVGLAGAVTAPILYARSPYATGKGDPLLQPIAFDHRHHVRDDGIDCLFCHDGAERSPYAGVPATERCMGCHNQIWNDTPSIAPLRDSAATGEPILAFWPSWSTAASRASAWSFATNTPGSWLPRGRRCRRHDSSAAPCT